MPRHVSEIVYEMRAVARDLGLESWDIYATPDDSIVVQGCFVGFKVSRRHISDNVHLTIMRTVAQTVRTADKAVLEALLEVV